MTIPASSATPTITFTPVAGAVRTNPVDNAQLVYIPEGQFTMGLSEPQVNFLLNICDECRPDHFYGSQPPHPVRVDAYWIYQTEVTNRMYAACVWDADCQPPAQTGSNTHDDYWGNPAYDDYPVVYVDWFAADRYCRWAGGRLPTDAEWEKAARGDDARIFPWGDAAPDASLANVGNPSGDNRPVGSYPQGASPYGVLDMAGNAWEWVADWHDINYYRYSPLDNPQGPDASPDGQRSGRGGNWYWHGAFASAAYHDWWEPENSGSETGFRCVVDAGS
jgi:formylglycine-generating enzyme required for sulfatase activity